MHLKVELIAIGFQVNIFSCRHKYTAYVYFCSKDPSVLPSLLIIFVITIRYACGIATEETYVVTGGYDPNIAERGLRTVTRYSRTGDDESLPQLNVVRYNHACGSYLDDNGDNVKAL